MPKQKMTFNSEWLKEHHSEKQKGWTSHILYVPCTTVVSMSAAKEREFYVSTFLWPTVWLMFCTTQGCGNLNIDAENIILKVYAHFSIFARRTEQLKEFYDFVEVEECNLLRHVVSRWLSLLPSIDWLLKCQSCPASYFQNLGDDECPKIL